MIVTLDINDEAREVDVQTGDTLLEILRERLGLLGASGLSELDPTFLRHGSSETRHLAAPSLPT